MVQKVSSRRQITLENKGRAMVNLKPLHKDDEPERRYLVAGKGTYQ